MKYLNVIVSLTSTKKKIHVWNITVRFRVIHEFLVAIIL